MIFVYNRSLLNGHRYESPKVLNVMTNVENVDEFTDCYNSPERV